MPPAAAEADAATVEIEVVIPEGVKSGDTFEVELLGQDYIVWGIYRGYIGMMEQKMETIGIIGFRA